MSARKTRCRRVVLFGVAWAVALSLGVAPARAGFSIVSQSLSVDVRDREVVFHLAFDHAPDFQTTDIFGRHAESFQYEIIPERRGNIDQYPQSDIRAVIRGDEINATHVVPIRDGFENGVDPDPAAGGWGPLRGAAPFSLAGSQMTFATSFDLLGTSDGVFAYRVFTTDYGTTDSVVEGATVRLPAALPAGAAMLALLALGWWRGMRSSD